MQNAAEKEVGASLVIRLGRVVGWVLVCLALAALGYEVLRAAASGTWRIIAAGELWYALDRGSLNFAQAIIQRLPAPGPPGPDSPDCAHLARLGRCSAPGVALVVGLSGTKSRDEHQEKAPLV